jgi:excisionase family DNA binding protein
MEEVTASQAAALTGLSERTIRRKIASGEIPARHVAPNRYAINVAHLPVRQPSDVLLTRIEELEHRVRLLELRLRPQRSVVANLASAPADHGDSAVTGAPALGELLMQLAHETDRLLPLLLTLQGRPSAASLEPGVADAGVANDRQVVRKRHSAGA